MREPGLAVRSTVQARRLNINIFSRDAIRLNYELFTVLKPKANLREERRPYRVSRRAGCHWIESRGAQDIPGGHLPTILVADQAVGLRCVELVHDLADTKLRLPGLIDVVVQIGDMMARFVAMRVLANQTRDVGLLAAGSLAFSGE